jgi:parallel beta-helix repeat protein
VTYVLVDPLPSIRTSLVIDGGGTVTISGGGRMQDGFTFAEDSSGSELRGVALEGFRNFAIRLEDATGVTISDVSVTSMNLRTSMGLYATGDLTGTTIVSSTFSGGLRGALLVNARNLAFGLIGQGNLLTGNRQAPRSRIAGTGIRAQGDCTGTVVEGNTFTHNNYGFAFFHARNLQLLNNHFARNTRTAIFVEGNNVGSVATGNTFSTGNQRNRRTFLRLRRARGV